VLFTQFEFIFYLIPFTLFFFYRLRDKGPVLLLSSLIFYASWNYRFLPLLIGSIIIGYFSGLLLHRSSTRPLLVLALFLSLLPLSYFKYAGFLASNLGMDPDSIIWTTVLPLGISFYTFQQIAYLIEIYKGYPPERNFLRYALFIAFFPQLIAGPIVRPQQILPQLQKLHATVQNFNIGLFYFVIGFLKKVGIADQIGPHVDAVYALSGDPSFGQSITAVLGYSLQIYFDFSGYCDMALGLGKLFGVNIPINFNSPYQSRSLIGFWRTWHITLSNFFRDYVYFPLGGNRNGPVRKYLNIWVTMLLCGLWHGANWSFVLWGGLHGVFLTLNHWIRKTFIAEEGEKQLPSPLFSSLGWMLTFSFVALTWVIFRAPDLDSAFKIYSGLIKHPESGVSIHWSLWVGLVILFAPNSHQWAARLTSKSVLHFPLLFQLSHRLVAYVLIGCIPLGIFFYQFYGNSLDKSFYRSAPIMRATEGIQNFSGDFRSGLFSNEIFHGNQKKILFIGSSFTRAIGIMDFHWNGQHYKSGTVGTGGNHLINGFRTALAVMDTPNLDTLVFGILPLNMYPLTMVYTPVAWPKQCTQDLERFGIHLLKVSKPPFAQCGNVPISSQDIFHFILNPSDKYFYQIHNFLDLIYEKQTLIGHFEKRDKIIPLDMSYDARKDFYEDLKKKIKSDSLGRTQPPQPVFTKFDMRTWNNQQALKRLERGEPIYKAFRELKQLCDERGIRLIVYNSPTEARIYQKGFLKNYSEKIQIMTEELEIEYYNLLNFVPWSKTFMNDFVHPTLRSTKGKVNSRQLIHKHLIYSILPTEGNL
jgi:alginate O-acetyltransferase complex protein AlgI